MSIGLLITINLLTIPFLGEAEELGKKSGKFPSFIEIFRLRKTLGQRWFKFYCVLLFIFLAIALAPTASGKTYPAGVGLIIAVACLQLILWAFVYLKISKFKK